MPEADAVARTCVRLHQALAGRPLTVSDLRWPGISTADLTGHVVTEVRPYGKHILIRVDNGWTLHAHLRMEGRWRVWATGAPEALRAVRSPAARAVLANTEWTAVGFDLGMLDLVRTGEESTLIGHLGQSVLDPGFDPAQAAARLAAHSGTIGAALLDQTTLAGLGTIWVSESLFAQRLNPWTPAASLSTEALVALVERARRLVTASMSQPVPTTTGDRRRGENTYVHSRSGRPCRRCGTPVRIAPIGPETRVRALNYCPTCQGGLAPGDDGRRQAPLGSGPSR
jgi:endonuclease-8